MSVIQMSVIQMSVFVSIIGEGVLRPIPDVDKGQS